MFYDISFLGPWLLLVLIIGGFVGWRAESGEPQGPWFEGWPRVALIALGVAFVLALLGLFQGRAEFWLESAVLFVVAYILGALAGGAIKRWRTTGSFRLT